jgi:aspartate aminotransferase|tara:strand:- start:121 stop:1326 length:1206 start_codon:yes stop_codon:yes gene_type:complete
LNNLLNARIRKAKLSSTVYLAQIAREYSAAGRKVINLAEGEPDFDTPRHIVEEAFQAAIAGATRYTSVGGTKELRNAIAEKFLRDNDLDYEIDQIMAGCGAKQLIFNAMYCTLSSSDEVIVPAPFWVSYPDIVELCGGRAVIVPCEASTGFKLTPRQLREALTPRTKWLILNSPNNPTGAVYSQIELHALAEVLSKNTGVFILCDDIYEHIVYEPDSFSALAAVEPNLKERTLTVNGVSKAYAMTGWRIGFAAGPANLIAAMSKLQGQSTTSPCSVSQAAAVAALQGKQDNLGEWREIYLSRRNQTLQAINSINGLTTKPPQGGFYLFVDCKGLLGQQTPSGEKLENDNAVVKFFLESAEVVLVPGTDFGLPDYFRLCFAQQLEVLTTATTRISKACELLR